MGGVDRADQNISLYSFHSGQEVVLSSPKSFCRRLWDTMKGVGNLREQDGGHGSRNPPRSV